MDYLHLSCESMDVVKSTLKDLRQQGFQVDEEVPELEFGKIETVYYGATDCEVEPSERAKIFGHGESEDLQEDIDIEALQRLLRFGFFENHVVDVLKLTNGETEMALDLLLARYFNFNIPIPGYIIEGISDQQSNCSANADARLIRELRQEEKSKLETFFGSNFEERVPDRVWALKLELQHLHEFFGVNNITHSFSELSLMSRSNIPSEENTIFEIEIRFPVGNQYPYEAPVICFCSSHPSPKNLLVTEHLMSKAREIAETHRSAILELADLLRDKHFVKNFVDSCSLVPKMFSKFSKSMLLNMKPKNPNVVSKVNKQKETALDIKLKIRNLVLKKKFADTASNFDYQKMLNYRKTLPAWNSRDEILNVLKNYQVVVISGETGCGKSTQVPQYILDEWLKEENHTYSCHVVCTQPRRISAIGVAKRVAEERIENIGDTVGYQIRLDSMKSQSTRLLFCTMGILLRRLTGDPALTGVTHVIVDEVHERSEESDFLLMILRDLLPKRKELRVILMSATVKAELFSDYFGGIPTVKIPGRTFPVKSLFMEDVLGYVPYKIDRFSTSASTVSMPVKAGKTPLHQVQNIDRLRHVPCMPAKDDVPDERLCLEEFLIRYRDCEREALKTLALLNPEDMHYDLIEKVIEWILTGNHDYPKEGAILVFLPGMFEIETLYEKLEQNDVIHSNSDNYILLPLHSTLSTEDQQRVFIKPRPGQRKIILSTNIAETSITIDDCVFVVDAGWKREPSYDPKTNMKHLDVVWISQSNALQREGRAGRVKEGVAFHLYTSHRFKHQFLAQPIPEILRVPLDQLVLKIKSLSIFNGMTAKDVLDKTIEPPKEEFITSAEQRLLTIGALDKHLELTPLGFHLASLAVDVRLGKLLLYGVLFRCLDDALTITAIISDRSPFLSPFKKREEANKKKKELAVGKSDLLTVLNAYNLWQQACKEKFGNEFAKEYFLSLKTLRMVGETKRQFVELLSGIGFLPRDVQFGRTKKLSGDGVLALTGEEVNANCGNQALLLSLVGAALYPNIAKILSSFEAAYETDTMPADIMKALRYKKNVWKTKDGYVFVHPSSVVFSDPYMSGSLAVYNEKVQTKKPYIREISRAPKLALVLLCGTSMSVNSSRSYEVHLEAGWIKLKFDSEETMELLVKLRQTLEQLFKKKVEDPKLDLLSYEEGDKIVSAIVKVLSES